MTTPTPSLPVERNVSQMRFGEDDPLALDRLFPPPEAHERIVANLGGGAGSSIMSVLALERYGRLDCVDFVNTGFENPLTLKWVEEVLMPYFAARGVPVHVLKPRVRRPDRPKDKFPGDEDENFTDSIREYYELQGTLPHVLVTRSCTDNFKKATLVRHRNELYGNAPMVVLIGFDVSEPGRVNQERDRACERKLFPLIDPWSLGKEALKRMCIERFGWSPPKSACEFCGFGRRPHFEALLVRDRATYLYIERLEEQDPKFKDGWTVLAHGPSLRKVREEYEANQRLTPEPPETGDDCDTGVGCMT